MLNFEFINMSHKYNLNLIIIFHKLIFKTNHGYNLPTNGTTKTRQFIYCGNAMCEARDENNNLVTQYFNFGQISYTGSGSSLTGTNYYLTRDELNSVREVTDDWF